MASLVSRSPIYQRGGCVRAARFLIVGSEGVREVGDYVSGYLSLRGDKVDRLLAFDTANMLGFYQVAIDEPKDHRSLSIDKGLVVGLSNASTKYERWLEAGASFLLDSSTVTIFPERSDIDTVIVPASLLAQTALGRFSEKPEALDFQELWGAIMLGAVLAVAEEYPEARELKRLFLNFHRSSVPSFVSATYDGYDWVQDRQMRGQSSMVRIER